MNNDVLAPGEISALLGRGTAYEGKLTFEGRVRLDGEFKGQVFSPGTLVIGEGANVSGLLEVGTLIVLGGVVSGEVRARTLVEVHAAGVVHADVETPKIFIDRGAVFDGRCTMGDEAATPSKRHELSGEQLLEELSGTFGLDSANAMESTDAIESTDGTDTTTAEMDAEPVHAVPKGLERLAGLDADSTQPDFLPGRHHDEE